MVSAAAASAVTALVLTLLLPRLRGRKRHAPQRASPPPRAPSRADSDDVMSERQGGAERAPRRIAILGGAFNPPTNQHILLATEIVHSGSVDAVRLTPAGTHGSHFYFLPADTGGSHSLPLCSWQVWLTPCGPRPDKPDMGTTAQQRLVMCEIAVNTSVSATFPISVTDHEVEEAMDTYDSLCHLRKQHPECVFSFVIGSDWLQPGTDLRTWTSKEGRTGDRLVSDFDFLVIRRPGYDVGDLSIFGPRFAWMDLPHGFKLVESTASSTEIRKRAKQSWSAEGSTTLASLDGLVAPGVHAYILRHKLYRKVAWRIDGVKPIAKEV